MNTKVAKLVLWLPRHVGVVLVWCLTFGAVDLRKKTHQKGVLRRIWGFFFPFLLSREPWPIVIPETIDLPGLTVRGRHLQLSFKLRKFGGRTLLTLPEGAKAWGLLALTLIGMFVVNFFAVRVNELNGRFMNSITEKDAVSFTKVLTEFGFVMGIFVVLGPVYSYVKALFILEWTKFTTKLMLRLYTQNRNFYPISLLRMPDNPNERIEQDIPAMCQVAMGFAFMFIDSLVTFFAFGGILWNVEQGLLYEIPFFGRTLVVEHLLLWVLVGYAILGSNGVVRVGRRLIALQAEQKRLSADFRVGMVLFEKYAEPIAAYHGQERERKSLWHRFSLALTNNYAIVRWQRNLGFFTAGYSRIASLLPYAAMAPFYFAGQIAFGTISQAVSAFGDILYSASIFVSEFDRLSGLLASVNRVGQLRDTLEVLDEDKGDGLSRITRSEGDLLKITNLTLYTPDRTKTIVRDLNLEMQPGESVLITGASGSGKTSILRAIIGLPLWDRGRGHIAMSSRSGHSLMLTQLAYLPGDASLREQLQYPAAEHVSDQALLAILQRINLGSLSERLGGLDARPNWDKLSGGERQRLVVGRALTNNVRLVIADEATSGLDIPNEQMLYRLMQDAGITMLSVGHRPSLLPLHARVIELLGDGRGGWRSRPVIAA